MSPGTILLPALFQPRVLCFSVLLFTPFRLLSPAESVHLTFVAFICGHSDSVVGNISLQDMELTVDACVIKSNLFRKCMVSMTLGRKERKTSIY